MKHLRRFETPQWRVATVLLAIVLAPLFSMKTLAGSGPGGGLDLQNEARVLDRFADDLSRFDKKTNDLRKKQSLTSIEFNTLRSSGDDLKRRLSQVQNAIRSTIEKLKAAGKWDSLEDAASAAFGNGSLRFLRDAGGARRLFEDAASHLQDQQEEIVEPLETLRANIRAQARELRIERPDQSLLAAIRVGYRPASPVFRSSLRCRFSMLRLGISGALRGQPTEKAVNASQCYCANNQSACQTLQQ